MNPDARLRRALPPVDPPEGFAQRVRARIERETRPAPAVWSRFGRLTAIAATVLAVLAGPLAWREYQTRRDALAARAQVLLALQIASRELNTAHRKVVRPVSPASLMPPAGLSGKEGRP
jgi:negative regulator of sigma E activity